MDAVDTIQFSVLESMMTGLAAAVAVSGTDGFNFVESVKVVMMYYAVLGTLFAFKLIWDYVQRNKLDEITDEFAPRLDP